MILHSWKHTGSFAFPREVSINFDALPGVLGIYGKNGAGKTTFLDTIYAAFYLEMPFRPKPLHFEFTARGFIDVVWSVEPGGRRYRSRINVDPVAERTEASLFPAEGGSAIAGPLQRSYLTKITELLGPADLFLATAYSVQPSYTTGKNTYSFLLADRAERRGLFAELLRMTHFAMRRAACMDRARAVETKLAGATALATQWEKELLRRPLAEAHRKEVFQRLEASKAALAEAQEAHQRAVAALQAAREAKLTLAPYREQRDVLVADMARLRTRREQVTAAVQLAMASIQAAEAVAGAPAERDTLAAEVAGMAPLEAAVTLLEADILTMENEIQELRERVAADRPLLEQADAIRYAATAGAELEKEIAAGEADLLRHLTEDADASTSYLVWKNNRAELDARDLERTQILDAIAATAAVPCGGTGEFAGCPFLTGAAVAQARLSEVDMAVTRLTAVVGDDREIPVPQAPVTERHLRSLRAQAADVRVLAGRIVHLEAAEARADDLATWIDNAGRRLEDKRAQRAEIQAQIARLPELREALRILEPRVVVARSLAAHKATADAKEAELAALAGDLANRQQQLAEVQQALAGWEGIERAIGEGDIAVVRAAGVMRQAQTVVTALERDSLLANQAVLVLEEVAKRLEATQTEIGPFQVDLDDWTLLNRAFSPAGIPALLVDQALPEISTLATDLLRDCLGETLFTIQLVTQRASADDKKLLEVLDVVIYRDGKVIAVEDLSGGEGVLVSEALALAIALYTARSTGRRPYTLFRDEVGANLDADRAPAYTRLLARALDMGGFTRVLFISHHEPALALADARIHVIDGAIKAE